MWSAGNRTVPRIGRQDAWQALVRRRQKVKAGAGGLTLLEGEPGVGRTTFLEAIVEESRTAGFRIASARASPVESPAPFGVISEALDLLRGTSAVRPPVAPMRTPSSIAFLPAMGGSPHLSMGDPLRATEEGAQSEVASDRFRLLASLAEPFLTASEGAPLLLAIDDLHWADEGSLEVLLYLLPQTTERPIWIVATHDPKRAAQRAAATAFGHLKQRHDVERVTLRPLSESEVEEFVRWIAPQRRFREPELRKLHADSGGLPTKLSQLVSPVVAVKPKPKGELSSPIDAELGIDSLPAEARRLLNFAVAAGGEFSLPILASAAGLSEERAVEHVEQFVELGLVREVDVGRFAFIREELRSRLYSELLGLRVRYFHQRLAEALEKTGATDASTVYALARHSYLGRLDKEAVRYNQRAAEFAAGAFQPAAALPYLEQALETLRRSTPEETGTELNLMLEIALQQARLGDLVAADSSLRDLRATERLWKNARPIDRALLAVYRARVMADLGQWEGAELALREIPAEFVRTGPPALRMAALRLRGEIYYYRGDYAEALAAHDAALSVASVESQPREIAAESIRRATVLSMLPGREVEALDVFRGAIDRLVELGDKTEASFGAFCLGAQLASRGETEEARRTLVRAIDLAEEAHDLRRSAWAYLNLADLEYDQNLPEEATTHIRKARAGFEQVEDTLGQARANLTEGRLAIRRGELDSAERSFAVAHAIFAHQNLEADQIEVELRRVELDLARHDERAARTRLEQLESTGIDRLRPDLVGDWRRLGGQAGVPAGGPA